MRSLYEMYPDMEDELETCTESSLRAAAELYSTEPPRAGGAFIAYLREEQRIRNIASSLRRSYNNNRRHIEDAYKYFFGTLNGFSEFWNDLTEEKDKFSRTNGNILCEPEYLFDKFCELPGIANRMERRCIKNWDQLVYSYNLY